MTGTKISNCHTGIAISNVASDISLEGGVITDTVVGISIGGDPYQDADEIADRLISAHPLEDRTRVLKLWRRAKEKGFDVSAGVTVAAISKLLGLS
jgi:hypothetical protein